VFFFSEFLSTPQLVQGLDTAGMDDSSICPLFHSGLQSCLLRVVVVVQTCRIFILITFSAPQLAKYLHLPFMSQYTHVLLSFSHLDCINAHFILIGTPILILQINSPSSRYPSGERASPSPSSSSASSNTRRNVTHPAIVCDIPKSSAAYLGKLD
jgi:hypothetical protein